MKLRLVSSLFFCFVGCSLPGHGDRNEPEKPQAELPSPMEVYRESVDLDPAERHFYLRGRLNNPTGINRELVGLFIARPSFAFGRHIPTDAPEFWLELIPERDVRWQLQIHKSQPAEYDPVRNRMTLSDGTQRIVREVGWHLKKYELMGVTAETGPAVFLAKGKEIHDLIEKRAAAAADMPTRKLDEFELSALEQLRGGGEAALQESNGTLRMLGAIRASEHCTECHKVPEGTLLGAFTYELRLKAEEMQPLGGKDASTDRK